MGGKAFRNANLELGFSSCVYCGQEATTVDHVPPRSLRTPHNLPHFEVPACFECNCLASDHHFESFDHRAKYLLEKALAKKRVRIQILALTAEATARYVAAQQMLQCSITNP